MNLSEVHNETSYFKKSSCNKNSFYRNDTIATILIYKYYEIHADVFIWFKSEVEYG